MIHNNWVTQDYANMMRKNTSFSTQNIGEYFIAGSK